MKIGRMTLSRRRATVIGSVLALVAASLITATRVQAYNWNPSLSNVFQDDFNGTTVDNSKWLIAAKQWPRSSGDSPVNGGVVPENVSVSGGNLRLEAHGDQYTGTGPIGLNGDNSDNDLRGARRVGAAIATRDYFASGKYEIRAKFPPVPGVTSAIWTYHYEEYYPRQSDVASTCPTVGNEDDGYYYTVNHEIDIEAVWKNASSVNGQFVTYRCDTAPNQQLTNPLPTDGQFHTYTIDWHTNDPAAPGNGKAAQRVDFLVDGVVKWTSTQQIPTRASRLWLGVWFPTWAGSPTFNTAVMEVDSVKITPYHERGTDVRDATNGRVTQEIGDHWTQETYPNDGWANAYHRPAKTPLNANFGNGLDPAVWVLPKKNWGGQYDANQSYNGGVHPQNVKLQNGNVVLEAHGDEYNGLPLGLNKRVKGGPPSTRTDGKRVGAAIATADYYGPGRYEIRMKVANAPGVSTAIWTYNYQELYAGQSQPVQPASLGWPDYTFQCLPVGCPDPSNPGDGYYAVNHEIDIEFPGRSGPYTSDFSFRSAMFNTWTGENTNESNIQMMHNVLNPQNDGQFHDYVIDWHTNATDGGAAKRVDFYVDGVKMATSTTHIPTRASRLWIATWFPNTWAGTASFDAAQAEVSSVKITPYASEPVDWYHDGLDPLDWANELEYPKLGSAPSPSPTRTTSSPTATASPTQTTSSQPPATNRIVNGDFQASNTGVTGWTCSATGPTAAATVATGAGIPGNALKLTPSDRDTAECTQTVTGLTPGTTYTFTADLKSSSPGLPYVYARVYNGAQTLEVSSHNAASYESKTIAFVAQGTSAIVSLQTYKQQSGDTFVDNARLT
ncbi:glycoside hydrolase family 16 protein [Dactylosporangium sp. NPDC049525]|uniref:glycoside hydrolase family 16 protein n=1 Tax=Dactylosporangium sp. NPDC049525 TaxID=3154730 RepID=UPI003445918F